MDDQRRLLDLSRTPRIILHRIDCLVHNVKEEPWNQETRSTLDQEELKPLQMKQEQEEPEDHQIKEEQEDLEHHQIKVEEEEVYCSQDEEQVELKQEADTCMVVPVDEQTHQTESEPNRNQVILKEATEAEKQNQKRRKPFSCVTCDKPFAGRSVFDAHMRTHTDCLQCNIYKQERRSTLDQEELESLQVRHEQEEPERQQIKEEQEYLKHQQIKVEEKEVDCSPEEQVELKQETDTCMVVPVDEQTSQTESESNRNQVFFQEAAEAENQNEEQRKPFSCVACGKGFKQKQGLTSHMTIHTGEKPFSCVTCGQSCSRKQILTPHMMIHTGEKLFSCVNCGKSFCRKRILAEHMMIHTGEKLFSCVTCQKSFRHKVSLT